MIYIGTDTKKIRIYKHTNSSLDAIELVLVNNLTKNEYTIIFEEIAQLNEYFYIVEDIDLSPLITGEYTYKLLNTEGETLESGLLVFGEYKAPNKGTYEKTKTDMIIYER